MAVFNVARAGRNQEGYMEQLINNMYHHPMQIFQQGYGVYDLSAEGIIYSFNAVRSEYCKVNLIKVHSLEITLKSNVEREMVIAIADRLGRVLYNKGFQSFVCAIIVPKGYTISAAVNAVSYRNGQLFYDNNTFLGQVYRSILEIVPVDMRMDISDNSFFDPEVMDGNYVHGVCI